MKVYVILEFYWEELDDEAVPYSRRGIYSRIAGVFMSRTQAEQEATYKTVSTIHKEVVEQDLQDWGGDD